MTDRSVLACSAGVGPVATPMVTGPSVTDSGTATCDSTVTSSPGASVRADGAGDVQPAPSARTLAPGEEVTVESQVAVPLSVTAGPVTIGVATGPTPAEQASTDLSVIFVNPPSTVLDHVDLGDGASESAHALTASAASGVNIEAGLTRRYTNSGVPGGWFEFDLRVTPGEPFILRMVETYNGPQHKTYDVLVDGVLVHERSYVRSAAGPGALTYQFVVDQPQLTQDGVVRVRFADVGGDHYPSIADVWAAPAVAGHGGE